MKKALFYYLLPILLLVLLGFSIFTPIYGDIGHRILGNTESYNTLDGYQNIWNFWWAKQNCLGFCGNMWKTDYQFYPIGTSLLFETWAYPSLYLFTPIMFFGAQAATAYNVALIFAVVTSLLSAYALVYYLTKEKIAAFIGATIYGLSPFVIGHILDGQLNLSNVQYFPLFLLFLFKSRGEKGILYKTLCGLSLLLLGLNDYVFLLFAFMIWLVFFLYDLFSEKVDKQKLVIAAKKNLIIFIVFFIPFFALSFNNFRDIGKFELRGPTKWSAEYSSANLLSLVTPPNYTYVGEKYFSKAYKTIEGIYSDKTVYLGIIPLLLSILGLLFLRGKREYWLWLPLTLGSVLLSLGPILHLGTKNLLNWMPFGLLKFLPFFDIVRAPSRFLIIVYLCLAVLSGYGVCYLSKKLKSKQLRLIIMVLLSAGILFEFYPINLSKLPETDLYMPAGYKKLMEDTSNFAIIESPALWMSGLRNESSFYPIATLYYQTIHGKKIANGYVTRTENNMLDSYNEEPLVKFLINQSKGNPLPASFETTLSRYSDLYAKNLLSENPYKYFVMLKDPSWNDLNDKAKKTLKDYLVLFYEDAEVEIFTFKNN